MANDARYMPLYVARYLADTSHLTAVAHGAYMLLIMNYWQRGKPLPDDDRKLSVIARCTSDEWAEIRDDLAEFFTIENGVWTHDKVAHEIKKAAEKIEQARSAGKKSGSARKQVKSGTSNGRSTDAERTLNHKVRLGKEDTNVSLSARGGAQKKTGWVERRTVFDAANAAVDRRLRDDDESRTGADCAEAGAPIQRLSASGSNRC